MLRVIGGTVARRKLKAPRSAAVRPTTDRVKETLFNILGQQVVGARFLDLFAGSGSVGLEAASRGASQVTLVDQAAAALGCLRENLATLGIENAEVLRLRLPQGLRTHGVRARANRLGGAPFDLIFVDPPYDSPLAEATLAALADEPGLTAEGCTVVVQHESRRQLPEAVGAYRQFRRCVVGSTSLSFFRRPGSMANALK
jgi:16S rRNA (guanine(966)-N(2))-methyltransferase RsmD